MFKLSALMGLALLAQGEPAAPAPVASSLAPAAAPAPAPAPGHVRLAKGTELEIELTTMLSSATSKLADRFSIRLVEPIVVDGVRVVAAGATGEGEVIDAAPKGIYGKRGKLVISARFLDLNGKRTRIRGMSLIAAGKGRVDFASNAAFIPYAGLAAFMITGDEIAFPSGTRATVKLAEDIEIPITITVPKGEVQ